MNARQTQDWSLGGCAAGALIVGAGVRDRWSRSGGYYGACASGRMSDEA